MKRIGLLVAIALAVVVGLKATPVLASGLTEVSDKLASVAKDKTIDGSAYLAGDTVNMDGTVKGDVYCAGNNVTISGTVEGDVLCAGRSVTIDGTVKGDVRLAGAKVLIKGTVEGSASLAGADITTDSASKISRDMVVAGSQVSLSGEVGRDVMVGSETAALSGVVGRNVEGGMSKLSFGSNAKVGGDVSYTSSSESSIPSGVVAGKVNYKEATSGKGYPIGSGAVLVGMLVTLLAFVTVTVLLTIVAPRYVRRVSDANSAGNLAQFFAVGLVALVLTPIVTLLLFISVVGFYAGIVLVMAVLTMVFLGGSLVAYRLGRFMLADKQHPVLIAAVGALTLGIVGAVPFVGWVVVLVSTITGVGMVISGMRDQYASLASVKTTEPVLLASKKSSSKKTK